MITDDMKEILKDEIKYKVLGKYGLPSKDKALMKVIDTWAENKGSLMELLSAHPNWNPKKYQIAFDMDVDREVDKNAITKFFDKADDYVSKWTPTFGELSHYFSQHINARIAALAKKDFPELRITEGQKTSKAVNKILKSLNVDANMGTYVDRGQRKSVYEREYAAYSDAINPLKIVRHTVISCHPADYLLASNGNSWSSCHTIDKHNAKSGYSGCRCSGTLSYMLDGSSMVFYHVDRSYKGDELELQPKIIRQMFHYSDGVLVQGRLYPQCNDGAYDLYVPTRAIMQKVLADCLNLPNLWTKKGGSSICRDFTESYGTHYRDYFYQNECSVSRILDMVPDGKDRRKIKIGHDPICLLCGEEHTRESWLYCDWCGDHSGEGENEEDGYYCADCGRYVNEEDVYWVGDETYCEDCVRFCESCQEYDLNANVYYYRELDAYICNDCIERFYTRCDCGHYCRNEDVIIDVHGNEYCPECASEKLIEIDGEFYPEEEVKACAFCGTLFVGEGDYCPDCKEEAENE